jgi:Ni/Co efflux regulator RcnB
MTSTPYREEVTEGASMSSWTEPTERRGQVQSKQGPRTINSGDPLPLPIGVRPVTGEEASDLLPTEDAVKADAFSTSRTISHKSLTGEYTPIRCEPTRRNSPASPWPRGAVDAQGQRRRLVSAAPLGIRVPRCARRRATSCATPSATPTSADCRPGDRRDSSWTQRACRVAYWRRQKPLLPDPCAGSAWSRPGRLAPDCPDGRPGVGLTAVGGGNREARLQYWPGRAWRHLSAMSQIKSIHYSHIERSATCSRQ